ncbi:MAG: hypothetical protein ACK4FP_10740 [Azonexus sp.]
MSVWFRRLPGFRSEPAGVERLILRRLPRVLVAGSLLLALPAGVVRLAGMLAPASALAAVELPVDIAVASLLILHWTVVLTVAIAAFIVLVMKGPAFVADAYPLDEADTPADAEGVR